MAEFVGWFGIAQQTLPRLDGMYWIMLAARVLHLVGAVILVGGFFYLRCVVSPSVTTPAEDVYRQFGGRRAAWAKWVGIATLLLLATGLWNYLQVIKMHERMASSYHMLAGLKMLAGLAMFALAAILAGRSPAAEALRQRMRFWLSVCLLLGLIVVLLGSVLRSYPHTRLADGPALPGAAMPSNSAPME